MIELKPGDQFFLIQNKTILQKGINLIQSFWAWIGGRDKSESPHTGTILNEWGDTFESRFKIGTYNMKDYKGCRIRIYRDDRMTIDKHKNGWAAIKIYEGLIYPVHRLPYFIAPGMAETLHIIPVPVCSENAGKYLFCARIRPLPYWGTDVDELEDWWKANPHGKLIYNDIWK